MSAEPKIEPDTVNIDTVPDMTKSELTPEIPASDASDAREKSNPPVSLLIQNEDVKLPMGTKPSEVIGGAPVRKWINDEVTPYLLEGMRKLAREQPEDPLRVLGEFLIEQASAKGDTEAKTG